MTNIKNKGIQIYHYSNTGKCSRYELAKYILNLISSRSKLLLNIDQNPDVIRPVFSSLNCSKIADYYNLKLIKWEEFLEKNIKKLLKK